MWIEDWRLKIVQKVLAQFFNPWGSGWVAGEGLQDLWRSAVFLIVCNSCAIGETSICKRCLFWDSCAFGNIYLYISLNLSISPYISLYLYIPLYLFIYLYIFLYLSISLYISLSLYIPLYLFTSARYIDIEICKEIKRDMERCRQM